MKNLSTRHWAVIIGCALYTAMLGASYDCTGLMFAAAIDNSANFTLEASTLFWTVRSLVNALTATLVTQLFLKISSKLYLIFLGALMAICYIPMRFYTNTYMWLISAVAMGMCNAGQVLILVSTINCWFKVGSGTLLGVCNAATSVFTAIVSPLLSIIIGKYGWETATVGTGFVIFITLFFCAVVLIPDSPEKVGLRPYGENMEEQSAKKAKATEVSVDKLLTNKPLLIYLVLILLVFNGTAVGNLISYLPTYANSLGHPLAIAAMFTSVYSIVGIFAKLLVGYLSDRIGSWKVVGMIYGIVGVSIVALLLLKSSVAGLFILSGGLGFTYSLFAILLPKLCTASFGDKYEIAFGRLNMLINILLTLFSYLLGIIFASRGGFNLAFMISLALCMVSLGIVFLVLRNNKKARRQMSI